LFKKFKGRTLPEILFKDPDWFFYLTEIRAFKNIPSIREEAEVIYHKACNVKIPHTKIKDPVVEYIPGPRGGFCIFNIVAFEKP